MTIVARAKNMLLAPDTEWPIVAAEPADVAGLYTGYICILSAIGPVVTFIVRGIIFSSLGLGLGGALAHLIVTYVLGLVAVYIVALVAAKLAPTFGGRDSLVAGLKLIAYSATARWVGAIFLFIPVVGWLIFLALAIYGFYLLYLGAAPTMGVPRERAVPYTVAVVVAVIVLWIVVASVVGAVIGVGMIAGHG
jgi:hypothetical protein